MGTTPVARNRNANVKTPGAVPPVEPPFAAENNGESEGEAGAPDTTARAGRSTGYTHLHSSEVDATTITAPVLCSDGWLAPIVTKKKPGEEE